MTFDELPPSAREFLAGFFGPGNELRLESMGRAATRFLEPWLDALADQHHPVLLPRVESNGDTKWYAIAFSERRARELKEELNAFVGPTYSDFEGRAAELDANDPIESSFSELEHATVFSFRVLDTEDKDTVRDVLSRMRDLWDVRPSRTSTRVRTTSRLLRDFEMALEVKNERSATKLLATLRREGRLSSQNHLFLKIRLLAAFHQWSEILEMPELGAVLDLHRRPQLVNQALIESLYATELKGFEAADQPEQALRHFSETVLVEFPQLFKSRGALTAPAVMKSFMMLAAASTPPRPDARDRVLQDYSSEDSDSGYLERLADLVEGKEREEERSPLALAQEARERNDFDGAFEHLKAAENGKHRLELMLGCAYEINTLEAARLTLEAFARVPGETAEDILATRQAKDLWKKLNELAEAPAEQSKDTSSPSEDIPDGWTSWLRKLNDEGGWPSALRVAEQGAIEWKVESLKSSPKAVQELARLIEHSRGPSAQAILRNALPLLLRYFLPGGEAVRQFAPIYSSLMYLLALDSQLGQDDMTALHDLTVSLLESGLSESQYEELVELLEAVWDVHKAPATIDWALDILDMLLAYPCRSEEVRERFFSMVLASFQGFARRLRTDQWELFELICEDFGSAGAVNGLRPAPEADEEEESQTIAERLRGKSIAIYTLTESVSRRVSKLLRRKFEGVSVSVSNAYGGTDRLRDMARNADIFLVATYSAKHAATEFISDMRPDEKTVLYPQGKGSSSMLRVLFEHLEQ